MRFVQHGVSNMGSLTARGSGVGRFTMDADLFAIRSFRIQFGKAYDAASAVSSSTANLEVRIDNPNRISEPLGGESTLYATLVRRIKELGAGGATIDNTDANVRFTRDEMDTFAIRRGEYFVFLWTNPDDGNGRQRWDIAVDLVAVPNG